MPKTAKNLYLDPDIIERAEEYSRRRGINLSNLVSDYLEALTRALRTQHGPLVQRLLGAGVPRQKKRGQGKPGIQGYKEHLDKKYGAQQ